MGVLLQLVHEGYHLRKRHNTVRVCVRLPHTFLNKGEHDKYKSDEKHRETTGGISKGRTAMAVLLPKTTCSLNHDTSPQPTLSNSMLKRLKKKTGRNSSPKNERLVLILVWRSRPPFRTALSPRHTTQSYRKVNLRRAS